MATTVADLTEGVMEEACTIGGLRDLTEEADQIQLRVLGLWLVKQWALYVGALVEMWG